MTEIETLVENVSLLYTGLERTGIRAIDALSSTAPELVDELLATFESRDRAANWLVRRMVAFSGFCALEMLSQGEREPVMSILHIVRDGLRA